VTTGGVRGVREGNATITYVELFNPTDYRVVLPSTASLSVSVNQIMPIERLHHIKGIVGLNQTILPTVNQTILPTVNQTAIKNIPNQLTRMAIDCLCLQRMESISEAKDVLTDCTACK
jgi:hypothetical protein